MYKTIEQAQEAVIQAVKEMVSSKLVASTWGNVSARIDNTDLIVITPTGIDYNSLDAKDLAVIDFDGRQLAGRHRPSSEQHLHIALLKNRLDIHAVMHTHSVFASAFSVIREPIPPIIEDMVQIAGGHIPVAPYFLPGTQELADGVVQTIGDLYGVLMSNHGFVGVGRSAHEAFKVCLVVEKAAQIYYYARTMAMPHIISDDHVDIMRTEYLQIYSKNDLKGVNNQ